MNRSVEVRDGDVRMTEPEKASAWGGGLSAGLSRTRMSNIWLEVGGDEL